MAEQRRDNSVLFSLKELRQIEDDRIKQEEEAQRARLEAERKAKEDAERRAREESERLARETADRLARDQSERERQLREEQLRLEAEKHRAQVEAAARIEEARLNAEAQAHIAAAKKKAPVKIILSVVAAVVLIASGTLFYVIGIMLPEQRAQERKQQEIAMKTAIEKLTREAEERTAQAISDAKSQMDKDFNDAIAKADTVEKKAELIRQREEKKQAVERAIRAKARADVEKEARRHRGLTTKGCDPNDPLCGAGKIE